jgi:Cd2+/Zn2+-exporting ATPase
MSDSSATETNEALQLESQTGRIGFQILATLGGGLLLICALVGRLVYDSPDGDIAGLLAMAATILLGAPLVWVAARDLVKGDTHMNELVALAVLAAFAMEWYFTAGAIAFIMIISVLIENRTALGAQASIESLIRITPTRANKLTDSGETEVNVKDLAPGDVVRVRPGDNIPADGRIIRGDSTVNEANITGESLPADKSEGDEVFGGTINLTGAMDVEVTKAGEDTTLGRVKELIIQAERTKTPLGRMIDRYTAWYTPTVLMLVFVVWFFVHNTSPQEAAYRAIALLVVACPAPLVLATPTAMVAAVSAAARLGVLVKSVVNLEAARNLTAMIFDKTGTLTTGELQVTRLKPFEGVDGQRLLQVAAGAEQNSRHPVARAVVQVARKARLKLSEPEQFEEVAGKGVKAQLDGQAVLIGRGDWIRGQSVPQNVIETIDQTQQSDEVYGLSTLFVVEGDQLLGWVGLADHARDEAAASVDALRELGLKRLMIVTGDKESVAQRVASQLHTEYASEVLPDQKLGIVDDFKNRGHRVAVVGDGVNDAPALAAGDIAIAMGAAGSDVAIHSASIVINNNNLNRIPFLVNLSRRTSAIVKQNLAIGGGYILLFGLLAAAGYVAPIWAAGLNVISSLAVIFNSARLVRAGEEIEQQEAEALAQRTGQTASPAPARSGQVATAMG